jgi:hypothetical protein
VRREGREAVAGDPGGDGGMAEEERVDVTDISNSPAFVALNELLGDGTLTAAQVRHGPPSIPHTLSPLVLSALFFPEVGVPLREREGGTCMRVKQREGSGCSKFCV